MRRTALAALCIAATATFALTGCLPGDKDEPKGPFAGLTGGEIADKAVKATTDAESLRMKGEVQDGVAAARSRWTWRWTRKATAPAR